MKRYDSILIATAIVFHAGVVGPENGRGIVLAMSVALALVGMFVGIREDKP